MANTYKLLNSAVVSGSSTTSVSFSSIPQTYNDLSIRYMTRSSETGAGYSWANGVLRFNSDSNTNYKEQNMWYQATSGNTTDAAAANNATSIAIYANNNSYVGNGFCIGESYILGYTSTGEKPLSVNFCPAGSVGLTNETLLWWSGNTYIGTSAITSIQLTPNPGQTWIAGTSFYLYGIGA